MSDFNPYAGNVLVDGLGAIRSPSEWFNALSSIPSMPKEVLLAPRHQRLFALPQLRDLHIVRREDLRVVDSIEMALRESYRYRDPRAAATWGLVAAEPLARQAPCAPPQGVVVGGHSGTGKTDTIRRILRSYPAQIIHHPTFPGLVGRHFQVAWLSVDVPGSGKAVDLAQTLMLAWDAAFACAVPDYAPRFWKTLVPQRRDGANMLEEWRQAAMTNFLGAIHLDEVQNLFKLPTLRTRARHKRAAGGTNDEAPELSIVEDQVLRWLLTLMNTWGIALILSGTPDGVQALMRRLATAERLVTGGSHEMRVFGDGPDPEFDELFLPALMSFQCVANPLTVTPELRNLLMELTAGVPRLLVALWVCAHRVAFEHKADALTEADIRKAAATYLAPVMPAVAALRSGDPRLMRRYEDLLPTDWDVWSELFVQSRP